jgi:hypothetical protein
MKNSSKKQPSNCEFHAFTPSDLYDISAAADAKAAKPAPAKQKTDLCAASLIMAAGVALSGFAFMFAPAGNQAAQVFAVCSLAAFSGLFFLIQSFNSVK